MSNGCIPPRPTWWRTSWPKVMGVCGDKFDSNCVHQIHPQHPNTSFTISHLRSVSDEPPPPPPPPSPSPPTPPVYSRYACQTAATKILPYCNPALAIKARVANLLNQLKLEEKLSLMGSHGNDQCAFIDGGVPRLDIPSYTWCTEERVLAALRLCSFHIPTCFAACPMASILLKGTS
jgi:hypothetical protein